MLRYRKVYFDLNLKILTIIIIQVFCSVLRLARSIGVSTKNYFVANNFIINDLAIYGRELVGITAFTMRVTFFT